jgi:hypothetical protein
VQETVRTVPRGSASGFSNHARSGSKGLDQPPAYETLQWTAVYVPRTFVFDPSLAPEAAGATDASKEPSVLDVTNQVSVTNNKALLYSTSGFNHSSTFR